MVERIGADRRVAAIELNVSCPNVVKGGMIFGNNAELLRGLVSKVRAATPHVLVVKLSPNVTDIVSVAQAAVDAGADALSLINTIVGLAIDLETRTPKIGFTTGGLSGPAIRPIALRMVWEVRKALPKIPIFGMGGIETVEHVVEFLVAGRTRSRSARRTSATPRSGRLCRRARGWCAERRIARVTDLVGTLEDPAARGPPFCLTRARLAVR